jgi:hypothetical protein
LQESPKAEVEKVEEKAPEEEEEMIVESLL